jgi:hypothetical protein
MLQIKVLYTEIREVRQTDALPKSVPFRFHLHFEEMMP